MIIYKMTNLLLFLVTTFEVPSIFWTESSESSMMDSSAAQNPSHPSVDQVQNAAASKIDKVDNTTMSKEHKFDTNLTTITRATSRLRSDDNLRRKELVEMKNRRQMVCRIVEQRSMIKLMTSSASWRRKFTNHPLRSLGVPRLDPFADPPQLWPRKMMQPGKALKNIWLNKL